MGIVFANEWLCADHDYRNAPGGDERARQLNRTIIESPSGGTAFFRGAARARASWVLEGPRQLRVGKLTKAAESVFLPLFSLLFAPRSLIICALFSPPSPMHLTRAGEMAGSRSILVLSATTVRGTRD